MITVHVNVPDGRDAPRALVERVLRDALAREGVGAAELSVTFLDDVRMTRMHSRHLGRPQPADVLSFALHERGEAPLGDIYVGADQAVRQAAAAGVDPGEEMARLALHGTLHVLGYDHPAGPDREESEMFRLQEALIGAAARRAKPAAAARDARTPGNGPATSSASRREVRLPAAGRAAPGTAE